MNPVFFRYMSLTVHVFIIIVCTTEVHTNEEILEIIEV